MLMPPSATFPQPLSFLIVLHQLHHSQKPALNTVFFCLTTTNFNPLSPRVRSLASQFFSNFGFCGHFTENTCIRKSNSMLNDFAINRVLTSLWLRHYSVTI